MLQSSNVPKTNLQPPVDFVGRERELQEILDALGPSNLARAWIVSLTGVGGIGKTELAIQAAHIAQERKLFEGIIWVTAKETWLTQEGIQPFETQYPLVSVDDILNTIIEVLELDTRLYRASIERKKVHVQKVLHATPCLLIIDNLETVQDRAVIQFLTKELPTPSKALVTTRLEGLSALDTAVAQTMRGQSEIRIGPLSQEDAITLFICRAKAHGFHFSQEDDLAKLQGVVNKTACIPLAIEWIVGQMMLKGETLDEALTQFHAPNSEVLKYCFENLIKIAGSRSQKVLLAVSLFIEPVGEDMLREVTTMQDQSLKESLERLTAASLIEKIPVGTNEWLYSVLAPTRLYVNSFKQQLADPYQEYCISIARKYISILQYAEEHQEWGKIKNEQHNILSIFSWCFENNQPELAIELAHGLSSYLQRQGLWDQRIRVCDLATIAASNQGNTREAMFFTYEIAEIHKARGSLDKAYEEFQRCEEYSRESGNAKQVAHAHMQLGIILYHKDQYIDSMRMLRQSLEMHRVNDDKRAIAQTLTVMGRNEREFGSSHAARKYFEDGLNIKRQVGDQLDIAISLYDLGHLYHKQRDLETAEQFFRDALEILNLDTLDEKRHQSNAKWYYALFQIDRGDLDAAKSLLMDVISIEEPLQRDKRLERASAKWLELERITALEPDKCNTDVLLVVQSSHSFTKNIVQRIIAVLIASISVGKEEAVQDASNILSKQAQHIISALKERWIEDDEAIDNLTRFEKKPERYKSVLEDILQEKLVEDKDLAVELSQLLS